jgi:hypothetical protein
MLFSQQISKESKKWLNESLSDKTVDLKELKTEFIKSDLSFLWLTKQENIVGFIENNYQRYQIHFREVIKNDTNPSNYTVKGSSRVGDNICTFKGEFKILSVREINKRDREEILRIGRESKDSDIIKRAIYNKYIVLTEYTFREDNYQKGSGIYRGTMKSFIYIKGNNYFYDDLNLGYSDSFSNNLCVGIWKSYKTGVKKKCNWGDYRIPYCGDLDIGAAEFSPNEKYRQNGWQNYYNAYFKNDSNALKVENIEWWK